MKCRRHLLKCQFCLRIRRRCIYFSESWWQASAAQIRFLIERSKPDSSPFGPPSF